MLVLVTRFMVCRDEGARLVRSKSMGTAGVLPPREISLGAFALWGGLAIGISVDAAGHSFSCSVGWLVPPLVAALVNLRPDVRCLHHQTQSHSLPHLR